MINIIERNNVYERSWEVIQRSDIARCYSKNYGIDFFVIVIKGTMVIRMIITYGLSRARDYIPRLSTRGRAVLAVYLFHSLFKIS